MNSESPENKATQGRSARMTGWAFLICLAVFAGPASADLLSVDFDTWPVQTSWATSTNGDGWVISDGQVRGTRGYEYHSASNSGWLADNDRSANSWLRSPLLPYGIGNVSFWHKLYQSASGTNSLEIQYSTNGTDWTCAAALETTNKFIWIAHETTVDVIAPAYIRIFKTGDIGGTNNFQGLDDVTVTEPPGVLLSNLRNVPETPSTEEVVNIEATAAVRQGMSNAQLTAMYRAGTGGAFTALPMAPLSGSVYRTSAPVPAGTGLGGEVQYYVQATCSGHGPSLFYLPSEGSNSPACYEPASPYVLTITNPASRAVFQRDASNYCTVAIAGTFSGTVDSVEIRATAMEGYAGAGTAWAVVGCSDGQFAGSLRIKGGWYRIEARAIKGGQIVDIAYLERVGVGEVLITAGQSNAANYGYPLQSPSDDRVSAYNPATGWRHADDPQPWADGTGGSPWPALGDALTEEFDVPVGILALGVGGTKVSEWLPAGGLYPKIHDALALTGTNGVRAILWHQGESDSLAGTLSSDYADMLQTIIAQSRADAGYEVPWGVALASYHPGATESNQNNVIAGQQMVITGYTNIFRGAMTDNFHLQGYLSDSVHFNTEGLTAHGQQWADCVKSNFFHRPSGSITITNVTISGSGGLTVGWGADTGATYQVQSSTNLMNDSWTNAGEWVTGTTEGRHSFSNQADAVRYYRIVVPGTDP